MLSFSTTNILLVLFLVLDYEDDLDSNESSGKDWSDLEEQAKRGEFKVCNLRLF